MKCKGNIYKLFPLVQIPIEGIGICVAEKIKSDKHEVDMKKIIVLLLLVPIMAFSQAKLGPFTFLDSKSAFTAAFELGVGGSVAPTLSFEVPPYGDLEFLQFIPGFCMKASVGTADGFFFQNALCARARYNDKINALVGWGIGVRLGESAGVYTPLIIGADYFLNEKVFVTGALQPGSVSLINLGIGMGWGF